jgi:hypothetical protein
MPYISKKDRDLIDCASDFTMSHGLDSFLYKLDRLKESKTQNHVVTNHGTLNYIITRLCHWWLGKTPNYEQFNSVLGVLEAVRLELYRRKIAPYEDSKVYENGDIE